MHWNWTTRLPRVALQLPGNLKEPCNQKKDYKKSRCYIHELGNNWPWLTPDVCYPLLPVPSEQIGVDVFINTAAIKTTPLPSCNFEWRNTKKQGSFAVRAISSDSWVWHLVFPHTPTHLEVVYWYPYQKVAVPFVYCQVLSAFADCSEPDHILPTAAYGKITRIRK